MTTLDDMGFLPSWIRRMKEVQNKIICTEEKNDNLKSGLDELEIKKNNNPLNDEIQNELNYLKSLSVCIIEELTEHEMEMENFLMEIAEVMLYPENPNDWEDHEPLQIAVMDGVPGFQETHFYEYFLQRLKNKNFPFFNDNDF